MIVEILTFGDELLDGRRTDTNSAWLGRKFTAAGIPPRFRQAVTDRMEDLVGAFRLALSRADFIVSTGGLGPTTDDITFEALAQAIGKKLTFHANIFERIEKRFEAKGLRCPESNRRQAMLPEGVRVIENEWGTAPGVFLEYERRSIFCLPGVPLEMENLFEKGVLPELERRAGIRERSNERIFHFYGLPESHLEERVEKSGIRTLSGGDLRIAYTASFPVIDVTLSTISDGSTDGTTLAQRSEEILLGELGDFLIGKNDETLESCVIDAMARRDWTLATAESLTGGQMAGRLVNVPGSSRVFDRGVITYSDRSKVELLGVLKDTLDRDGAVSEACALEMARGVQRISGSDVGLASTGIAGPSGGSEAKPVGLTFLAWVGPFGEHARKYQFRWDRNRNRMLAVYEGFVGLLRLLEGRNL